MSDAHLETNPLRLRKVLTLWDFIFYGLVLIQPTAPISLFGVARWTGIFSTQPFYDPKTFSASRIWGATSFAALTYIGFDGITTLSEDVSNPRRNVLLATVLVCVITGLFSGVEVYLGQRIFQTGTHLRTLRQHLWMYVAA